METSILFRVKASWSQVEGWGLRRERGNGS